VSINVEGIVSPVFDPIRSQRDLLIEAMHDLFEKHGLVIVRGCDKCGNGNGKG
jgi:hypothetical protein